MSNVQVNIPSTAGAIVATDTIVGVDHQLVKVEYGDAGSATQVSSSNPLPVTQSGSATSANQATEISALASILAKIIAAPSTEAKQDTMIVILTAIAGYVDGLEGKDYATQTTLAALTSANHTDLAAILAKLITAPATEAKQDTGNTSLSSIDSKLSTLNSQTDGVESSLTSIDGRLATLNSQTDGLEGSLTSIDTKLTSQATAARQDTGNTSIASVDTKMSTLLSQTDGIESSLASIDAGTPAALGQTTMSASQPVVLASDQTGIPITSIIPGVAATNLGKAEDSPHSTGDVGVMALAVRNDAGAVLAGNDNDYVPMTTDSTGALRVDMNGTASTNNSTTTPLAASAVFTGTSEDVLNYNEIRVTVYSDVASGQPMDFPCNSQQIIVTG
jgi:hypothetical protein